MKKRYLSFVGIIFLLCVFVACKKDKDSAPDDVPPVNNNNPNPNPNPVSNPKDSTPKPPPVFADFFPASANIGDTITLTGENLDSNMNVMTVRFGEVKATIVSASKTMVKAIVPDDIAESKTNIELIIEDTVLYSNKIFNLKPPVIESISHTSGFGGQSIVIKGKGFRYSYKFDQVIFGDKFIPKGETYHDAGALRIYVPSNTPAGKYPIAVSIAGLTTYAPDSFTVIVPVIKAISLSGDHSNVLTITGENFIDANGSKAVVTLNYWPNGSIVAVPGIFSLTNNEIKAMIYLDKKGQYKVSVRVLGSFVSAADPLIY